MKYLKLFERINPTKINKEINLNFEDNEEEEDDINFPLDKLIGGTIYRAYINFVVINLEDGSLKHMKMGDVNREYFIWGSGNRKIYYNKKVYDINIEIEKCKILDINKKGSLVFRGKRIYSIHLKSFFKDNKINDFYLRPNDILAFDKESLKSGLLEFVNSASLIKDLSIRKLYFGGDDHENVKNEIEDIKLKIKNVEFLLNNIENVNHYLNKSKLKMHLNEFTKKLLLKKMILKNKTNSLKELINKRIEEIKL